MTNIDLHLQTALVIKLSFVFDLMKVEAAAELVFDLERY